MIRLAHWQECEVVIGCVVNSGQTHSVFKGWGELIAQCRVELKIQNRMMWGSRSDPSKMLRKVLFAACLICTPFDSSPNTTTKNLQITTNLGKHREDYMQVSTWTIQNLLIYDVSTNNLKFCDPTQWFANYCTGSQLKVTSTVTAPNTALLTKLASLKTSLWCAL